MKVLYLINFAGKGGTEKYVENLVDYLHPEKCECCLCYNIDGPLAEKMRSRGLKTFQLDMKNPFDKKAAKALARICRENDIDVVHAQFPRENYIAIAAKKYNKKIKVIFTSHLIINQSRMWKFFNRLYTPKNHCIISVCDEGRNVMIKNGVCPEHIKVIFNGIDTARMPERDPSVLSEFGIKDELVISILSRLSPEKGIHFLCDSVKELKNKTSVPFKLLLIGDGELTEEIKEKLKADKTDDTVILTGYRNDTDKLLAASDIYLNTSEQEAMSLAILEALANGLPVVATDVGGNHDLVNMGGSCGFTVKYGDTEDLSNKVKLLLEDEELRRQYGEIAREKTTSIFDTKKLLDDVYETYK